MSAAPSTAADLAALLRSDRAALIAAHGPSHAAVGLADAALASGDPGVMTSTARYVQSLIGQDEQAAGRVQAAFVAHVQAQPIAPIYVAVADASPGRAGGQGATRAGWIMCPQLIPPQSALVIVSADVRPQDRALACNAAYRALGDDAPRSPQDIRAAIHAAAKQPTWVWSR